MIVLDTWAERNITVPRPAQFDPRAPKAGTVCIRHFWFGEELPNTKYLLFSHAESYSSYEDIRLLHAAVSCTAAEFAHDD